MPLLEIIKLQLNDKINIRLGLLAVLNSIFNNGKAVFLESEYSNISCFKAI